MIRPIQFLTVTFALTHSVFADFDEDLAAAKGKGPDAVAELQSSAEDSEADNPAYYVALANYWFARSQAISISTKPADDGDFVIADQQSGQSMGSLSRGGVVDPALADKAPALLQRATERFPARLDIALGLATVLAEENRYADCLETFIDLTDRFHAKPTSFVDKDDRPMTAEATRKLMANGIYDRAADLYADETAAAAETCRSLVDLAIEEFPPDPRPLNLLAALDIQSGNHEAAINSLKKARAIDAADPIVALNLADQYLATGNKAKAREIANDLLANNPGEYEPDARAILDAAKDN